MAVKEAVRELLRVKQEVFMPLVHRVGEAQVILIMRRRRFRENRKSRQILIRFEGPQKIEMCHGQNFENFPQDCINFFHQATFLGSKFSTNIVDSCTLQKKSTSIIVEGEIPKELKILV
jgi:hypothetical protein